MQRRVWRTAGRLIIIGPLLLAAFVTSAPAVFAQGTVGQSRTAPVPLNQAIAAGPWTMSVLEIETGDAAARRITQANAANFPPADGIQYIAVRLRVSNTSETAWQIGSDDFAVTGSSGLVRRSLGLFPPAPVLAGNINPGETIEGWFAGAAGASETNLMLMYDSTVISGDWADCLFALQAGATIPDATAPALAINDLGDSAGMPAVQGEVVVTSDWGVELTQTVFGSAILSLYDPNDKRTLNLETAAPGSAEMWLALQFQVTDNRTGGAPSYFPPNAFALVDLDGSVVPDVSILTPPRPDAAGGFFPGGSRLGWVVFELPAGYAGDTVRFLPAGTASDARYLTWGDGSPRDIPTPTSEASRPVQLGDLVVVTEDIVNLRSEPSTTADVLEELTRGTELVVTGDPVDADGYTWYPVRNPLSGLEGYVAADFVTLADG